MKTPSSPHVAIVGAGPAGSAAATFLARRGARVTLLERGRFPRDKICGDGLTPRSCWMLDRLGLRDLLSSAEAAPVSNVVVGSPSGAVLDAPLPRSIFGGAAAVVPRLVLDERLAQNAVRAGAELREGVTVEGLERHDRGVTVRCRGGGAIHADVVLGCDGSPSILRRALGAPPFPDAHGAFAVRAYYEGVDLPHARAFSIFWEADLLPAYGWIFPLPGGRANVGIGMRTDCMVKAGARLPALLERFCARPRIAAQLRGGRRVGKVKGHHLPYGSFSAHTVFDRALLLGDAAGFINPLTGEGIELALESGEHAARAIEGAASAGAFGARALSRYRALCDERFRAAFRLNYRLQRVFEQPWLIDRLFRAAHRSERVMDELAGVMLGERSRITPRLVAAAVLGA